MPWRNEAVEPMKKFQNRDWKTIVALTLSRRRQMFSKTVSRAVGPWSVSYKLQT